MDLRASFSMSRGTRHLKLPLPHANRRAFQPFKASSRPYKCADTCPEIFLRWTNGSEPASRRSHWSHSCDLSAGPTKWSGTFSPTNSQVRFPLLTSKTQFANLGSRTIQQPLRLLSTVVSRQHAKPLNPDGQNDTEMSQTAKKSIPTILTQLNPLSAKERKENIYTLPNILTFSRLIAAPAIGYAILTSHPHLALGLFAYAGITDLVDGYLARRFNSQTVVGTVLDPMADKTLMTIVVVCLTIQGVLPTWLAVIILGRDVALAISAIYFRWISLPPPKTFSRYWDFSLPSAEVHPTEISKINTFLQLLLVGNAMVLPALPTAFVDAWNLYGVFEGWQFLVAGTTLWSGLSYVYNKDAVKILTEQEVKEKRRAQAQKQTS